ncbi:MAG: hypothetical protein IPM53_10345 [Anaerolineaceae bacterium]|nr:hypothetical protein [Anaerolineaceae bacterium]
MAITVLAQVTEPVGVPPWVPLVIGVILLLLFWWGLNRNNIPQGAAAHGDAHHDDAHHADDPHEHSAVHHDEPHAAMPHASAAEGVAEARTVTAAVTPDDLKLIEGIGPKIETILHEAGIHTFAELAQASIPDLEKIVREDAGIRIAFPDTWAEQAKLAAAGRWTELEQLQEQLKGGRHA